MGLWTEINSVRPHLFELSFENQFLNSIVRTLDMKSFLLIFIFLLSTGVACKREHQIAKEIELHEAMIKNNIRVFMDSCWNTGDVTNFDEISTKKFIRNLNGITVAASQREMHAHMTIFFTGFPDLNIISDSTYINNNTAFLQWTSTGTHTGMFGDVAPTGKKVKINGLSRLHFNNDGKLYQEDVSYNELDLLQQLGYTLNRPILE